MMGWVWLGLLGSLENGVVVGDGSDEVFLQGTTEDGLENFIKDQSHDGDGVEGVLTARHVEVED